MTREVLAVFAICSPETVFSAISDLARDASESTSLDQQAKRATEIRDLLDLVHPKVSS